MTIEGDSAGGHLLWELVQTAHVAERRFAEVFAASGLTPAQYGVLASLGDHDTNTYKGTELSQADLARAVLVRPQSLAGIIDALVTAGLVVREGPPGRGRRKALSLSQEGREVLAAARPAAYRLLESDVTGLNQRQTQQLASLLRTVRDHLTRTSTANAGGPHERARR